MSCNRKCQLCPNFVVANAVNFDGATNALLINIPRRDYKNCCIYCIAITDTIPTSTTINAQVFITIDGGVERYPLVSCDCMPISACQVSTRSVYKTCVRTDAVSGVFRLTFKMPCCNVQVLQSLPAPTPAPAVATLRATKVTKTTTTKKEVVANE